MIQCFVVYHKLGFSHIKWSAIREHLGRRGEGRGVAPRDKVSLHRRNCADWATLIDVPCLYWELSEVQERWVTVAVFAEVRGRGQNKRTGLSALQNQELVLFFRLLTSGLKMVSTFFFFFFLERAIQMGGKLKDKDKLTWMNEWVEEYNKWWFHTVVLHGTIKQLRFNHVLWLV